MTILLVIHGTLDQVSGGYHYDRKLVAALERAGHRVVTGNPGKLPGGPEPWDLIIIDELCHPDFWRHGWRHRLPPHRSLVAMVHHLAVDEGGPPHRLLAHGVMERGFFRPLDLCIFNSPQTEASARWRARYRGPGVIAYPGRDERPASPPPPKGDSPLHILFLGNLIPRKGVHRVVEALGRLKSSGFTTPGGEAPFRLVVAGNHRSDPAYTRKVQGLVRHHRLEGVVEFTGPVSEDHKARLLAEAHLMAMPSRHEGFGISYLEAMGYRCIPLGSESGGAAALVTHGCDGFLVPPGTSKPLEDIIMTLVRDPRRREALATAARLRWEGHPDWDACFLPAIRALESLP